MQLPKKTAFQEDQKNPENQKDILKHGIKVEIQAFLTNSDGKVIRRYPWKQANSLLKQFIQVLMAQLSQASQTVTDTGGTSRAGAGAILNLKASAGATDTTFGIVIGTGETTVTMTDYKLQTQVTTNIAHAITTFATENPDTSTWRAAISRALTNNTGATLSVKEVGLYCTFTASGYIVCADRTLYAVDVPSGVSLTLTYRVTVSL